MDILTGSEINKAIPLYDAYDSNQAVIYSILENQFDGCIYTDNKDKMNWTILRTPFLQHFIAGSPVNGCETIIEEVLFNIILREQTEKEIVVFSDSVLWHDILNQIFIMRKGVSDGRKIFSFNHNNYVKINQRNIPDEVTPKVELRKCLPDSHKNTWSARLFVNEQEVSHCNAIMIGKGMAEIDIGTDEKYRSKGYATLAAALLIDKLLEHNLTPTWSTWPFRIESQHIAQKLGFNIMPDAKAWIWMENL